MSVRCESAAEANRFLIELDQNIDGMELPRPQGMTKLQTALAVDRVRKRAYAILTSGRWLDEYRPRQDHPGD